VPTYFLLSSFVCLLSVVETVVQTRSYDPVGPRDDATRFADPPSSSVAVAPSARRGHSLAVLHGRVYLFGGLAAQGYECRSSEPSHPPKKKS